jgi:hypothetical protein
MAALHPIEPTNLMNAKRRCRTCASAAPSPGGLSAKERVLRQLRLLSTQRAERDPILVELESCKEAYGAGKIMETAFHRVANSQAFGEERILPMAGTIIPPLV